MTDLSDRAKAVLAGIEAEMSREGGGDVLQSAFEIIEELLAAPVSKRVERLETLLTQALHVLDQPEIYTIWPVSALRMEITQALQGGRS